MFARLLQSLKSMLMKVKQLTILERVRYTYGGDEHTKPHISGQRPDTIAEVGLNCERNDCAHEGYVYGGVMRVVQCLDIAVSTNKPIMDISPGQRRLGSFQRENEIDWSRYMFSEARRMAPDAPSNFVDSLSFGKL